MRRNNQVFIGDKNGPAGRTETSCDSERRRVAGRIVDRRNADDRAFRKLSQYLSHRISLQWMTGSEAREAARLAGFPAERRAVLKAVSWQRPDWQGL